MFYSVIYSAQWLSTTSLSFSLTKMPNLPLDWFACSTQPGSTKLDGLKERVTYSSNQANGVADLALVFLKREGAVVDEVGTWEHGALRGFLQNSAFSCIKP